MKSFNTKSAISKTALFFLLALAMPALLSAQNGNISGRVVDAKTGEPMAAANVVVKGTNYGSSVDLEGNYTIKNVPVGTYTVTANFISHTAQSKTVQVVDGETVTVNFELEPSILNMDELVVTATGVRRKVEIGNSIARIDAEDDVKMRPIGNISDLLQGQAAAVQILESSGSVGMGSRIRIRGSNSASLSNEPVVYIDGVLVNNQPNSISFETGGQSPSRINDINSEDIESIEIIKGPSAATLYGSVAANGVIRITTKRGRTGRARWSAFLETGLVNDIGDYPANYQALDANGNPCFTFEAAEGGCTQATINSFQPLTDPATSPFRTGVNRGLGLSVSGGTEKLTYFLSGNFSDRQGVLPINNILQGTLRGNFGAQVSENLRVDLSTSYVSSDMSLPLNDNFALGLMGQGLNGAATRNANDGWGEFTPDELFTIDTRQNIDRFTTGLSADWKPSQNLSFRMSGGLDFTSRWDNQFFPTGKAPAFLNYDQGARFSNRFNEYVYTLDMIGSYSRKISDNITSRTSVGFQYLQNLIEGTFATGLQLVAGSSSIAGAATTLSDEETTEQRTVGVFIEEQLVFSEKLFVTGAIRSDRGSAFGAAFDAVVYPKLGVSWLMNDEPFIKNIGWMNSLRLRGAWGESGVQPGTNAALRFFNPIAATVDGGKNVTGVTFGGVGNADLRPERSREIELGVDATLFSDRVGLELTYFNKQTEDALVFRQLPLSLGVGAGRFENLGSVANTGIEISLNTRVIDTGMTTFNLGIVGAFLDNELKALGEGIEPVIFGTQRHVEGYPLGGYWDEEYTYNDANGDGLIGRDEVQVGETVYLGSPFATKDFSFTGSLGLLENRFEIRALLSYRGGMKLYNNTGAWRNGNSNTRELNDPDASLADQARAIASKFYGTNAGYIEDASFWRLREVSLTYNFPKNVARSVGVGNMSLTVSGRNLGLWTGYSGLDPEINSTGQSNFVTQEFLSQPPVRSWKARLNVTF
ncbi:MAG TPA: SusC/RagA family TonB-linked outer membrane protein [Bacteroidetes bacterium]|nr:SusC/RagA family TonB-linked outer membrane protein [Bacteroidota bacterium]